MKMRARSLQALLGAAPILLIAGLWQVIAASGYAPRSLLPTPADVFARLVHQLSSSEYLSQIGSTLWRLFAGFAIAAALGVSLGLWAAMNRTASAIVRPIVRLLAPVPKIALYPAFLLVLGFDHASKISLVAADALFPILLSTFYGASVVEHKLVWSALAAGTPARLIPFKVIVPAAMPSILTGCRIGLVISCIVVFLAEMISSTDGLGYVLVRAARSFQTIDMFVPLVTISLLGLLLNGFLYQARRYFLRGFPEV
jgi:NitT/TauT family transport system permease protein